MSSLWATLSNLIRIKHIQTTAYHQQSNGLVEHFRYSLKDVLLARCYEINWTVHLAWVLLGLCSAASEDDNTTPTQAVFSSPLILSGQFLDSPELPSDEFLLQFSLRLSAAEHSSTKHNTAVTPWPPAKLPDALFHKLTVFVLRKGHVLTLQLF
jgi:hypothetical protein